MFFYVAPFRYPSTSCGLLFSRRLEAAYAEHGVATPFDSGGLVSKVQRADPDEDVCAFLARHELPVPEHRAYLRGSIQFLFGSAADYVHGRAPALAGLIGLTGTDPRCWTHDVRIPESVPVRSVPYLEAVFVPRARAVNPEIASLLEWCIREAKEVRTFDAPTGDDFRTLQQECIRYIEEKLY
ncbi:MAG: hypothetical protein JNK87_41675 [Bryobacterales bacterium]|nr:hypothetical protein [Bryobacterales bacterium]